MRFEEWEPVYEEILRDFGWSRYDDESSVRMLKSVTLNSDLIDDEDLLSRFSDRCTVIGNAPCLESDLSSNTPCGTIVASGSSVGRLVAAGFTPDVVVTDLDGDIGPQLDASSRGAVTVIHAHGDNQDLIRTHAGLFRGPVVLSTQAAPQGIVYDFGGFTDGDRAVCIAREAGCSRILLLGFDYDHPMPKGGSDPELKRRKLAWARRIIHDMNPSGTVLTLPSDL